VQRQQLHTRTIYWKRCEDIHRCKLISFRSPASNNIEPLQALTVNDTTSCNTAMKHLDDGKALVYSGQEADYHNARQLLQAIKRRYKRKRMALQETSTDITGLWMKQKKLQEDQSDVVNRLLIQIGLAEGRPSELLNLNRVPTTSKSVLAYAFKNDRSVLLDDQQSAMCDSEFLLLSLSDHLAMIGSYEWNRKGIYIHALQDYIYPHFGVFPPTRQDYISLIDHITVDSAAKTYVCMLEVGVGTGVLSMILMKQNKVHHVQGTDINPYAVACAQDNIWRHGLNDKFTVMQADLFPASTKAKYDIILFNPPWLPGNAAKHLDDAVYDSPKQDTIRRFLTHAHQYLHPDGQIYLIMSNLGILLGLYQEDDLHQMVEEGNLEIVKVWHTTFETKKSKRKAEELPIESARAKEVISLYQLRVIKPQLIAQ
jgi:predicted RNA methylase